MASSSPHPASLGKPRRFFSRGLRNTLLTAHIAVSVGLLGDTAGFLAVAIRAARTPEADATLELMRVLKMFGQGFGIPLSFAALLTGIALGWGTQWGVLRYPWVVAKLLLIVSVMIVGGAVIGPALGAAIDQGANVGSRLIAAATFDIVALTLATALSVFKPGGPFRARANTSLSGAAA